ncbi:MAG: inosine/xanthosine triphosphatase [Candidatus Saccharimonadales bacterium]
MKIIVASKNPIKIAAVRSGFENLFPEFESIDIEGVSVPSGVRDQPMTFEETLEGAKNRVVNAKADFPDADFWVGLEGGVDLHGSEMAVSGWVVAEDKSGRVGKSMTNTIYLPPRVAELVAGGMELGEADDVVFGTHNSKQSNGAVGILTHDVLQREEGFMMGVVGALVPHRNPELY